ncbi:MAG: hypothetical protein Ct9H300mP24_5370 [Candidatus Neomarinimicrobiota bacterium]|nr:MAG: hypothetical protein Ct9H300mP24_5370 [Candidatus Neomarinimicrobiota bacterium]
MDITTAILITVAILFCTNLIGYIYTALILHTNLINDYRIQPKEYFAKRFYERFPLILFNISILLRGRNCWRFSSSRFYCFWITDSLGIYLAVGFNFSNR